LFALRIGFQPQGKVIMTAILLSIEFVCLVERLITTDFTLYFCPFISDCSGISSILDDLAGLSMNDNAEHDDGT
jgi:hypothetical protein